MKSFNKEEYIKKLMNTGMSEQESSKKAEEHQRALAMLDKSLMGQGIRTSQSPTTKIAVINAKPEIIPPERNPTVFKTTGIDIKQKRESKIESLQEKNLESFRVTPTKKNTINEQGTPLSSFPGVKSTPKQVKRPIVQKKMAPKKEPFSSDFLPDEPSFSKNKSTFSETKASSFSESTIDEKLLEVEKRIVFKLSIIISLATGVILFFLKF